MKIKRKARFSQPRVATIMALEIPRLMTANSAASLDDKSIIIDDLLLRLFRATWSTCSIIPSPDLTQTWKGRYPSFLQPIKKRRTGVLRFYQMSCYELDLM